jgi:exopolysaccharide production protein ExoQ
MSQEVILYVAYGFIVWLFIKDMAWRKAGSRALLIPGAWIAIQGSRPVSYWFGGEGGSEANPIDTLVFVTLVALAVLVLINRHLNWGTLIRMNKPLFLIYFYLLLSMVWSEMPFISLKRLIKDFGCVLMCLVMLTEENPAEKVRILFVRISYILFPLSVVFIKYFPGIGRSFSRSGEAMFGGVTTQKNSLGEVVFVFSLMLLWDLFEISQEENRKGKTMQIAIRLVQISTGLWLLVKCDSQTSLICLILGSVTFWGSRRLVRMKHGKRLLIAGLATAICLVAMDKTFGISDTIIRALGRDPNLTGRTDIWRIVLAQKTDPILGNGFYTFWDSSKGKAVMDAFMKINSTHNGYLEMYVDGGLVCDFLLVILLLTAGNQVIKKLFSTHPLGKIGLMFWLLAIIYNMSETSFFRLDPLWIVLLLVMIECPLNGVRSLPINQDGATI